MGERLKGGLIGAEQIRQKGEEIRHFKGKICQDGKEMWRELPPCCFSVAINLTCLNRPVVVRRRKGEQQTPVYYLPGRAHSPKSSIRWAGL